MEEEQIIENFVGALKLGLPGVESKGTGGYQAKSKVSTATGKYQFLEEWLDDIQKFAGDLYGNIDSMEDFKNNPQLQEDFFGHYAKTTLYPQAKKAVAGPNPLKLTLEEAGALFHYQSPKVAKDSISSGNLPAKTETNMSGAKYLNIFNRTLNNYNYPKTSQSEFFNDKQKKSVIDQYEKQNEAINNKSIPQESKELLRNKLRQDVVNSGHRNIINEHLKQKNKERAEKQAGIKNLLNTLKGADVGRFEMKQGRGKPKKTIYKDITSNWNQGDPEQLMEQFPELKDYFHIQKRKNGDTRLVINQKSKYGNRDTNTIPKFMEEFNGILKDTYGDNYKEAVLKKNTLADPYGQASAITSLIDLIKPGREKSGFLDIDDDFIDDLPNVQEEILIDQKTNPKTEKPYDESPENITENSAKSKETNIPDENKPIDNSGFADDFFNRELQLNSVDGQQFNYKPGKKELNIDAITGVALGLIGDEQAENANIPLRTEEVSQAMKNYVADIKRNSELGLPVEVEAAVKNQLADAYQGGLENIVNASAGNRATVLGNLGSLEQAKNKGLVNLQVADYEARDRAFAQYGRALEYVNDFNARREIANHGIKYREAKDKQQMGRDLSVAGFDKLIRSLQTARQTGPGSPYDMERSFIMQDMFGFDPKMPDDGTGQTPGTKSHYDKMKQQTYQRKTDTENLYNRYQNLNPNQKTLFNNVMSENQNYGTMNSLVDYMGNNPDSDLTKFGVENLDLALKDNNFDLLGMSRERAEGVKPLESFEPFGMVNQQQELPEIPTLATNGFNPAPENNDNIIGMIDNYFENQ